MRKDKLEYYRKKLLKRHKEITDNYVKNKGNSKEDARDGTEDYIDYAVNSYAKEFLLSLTEIDRKQLVLVEDAIKRITNKTYGRCQQCSQEISSKRLEAAPWARHCVKCQELEEQGVIPSYALRTAEEEEFDFDEEYSEEAAEEDEEYTEGIKKVAGRKKAVREEHTEELEVEADEEE